LRESLKLHHQRMDLRKAPLVRLKVAADPNEPHWYALVQFHHITCDHETVDTVISEVVALLEHRGDSLPDPAPYRIHVAQALAYARSQETEAFFRKKLRDVSE